MFLEGRRALVEVGFEVDLDLLLRGGASCSSSPTVSSSPISRSSMIGARRDFVVQLLRFRGKGLQVNVVGEGVNVHVRLVFRGRDFFDGLDVLILRGEGFQLLDLLGNRVDDLRLFPEVQGLKVDRFAAFFRPGGTSFRGCRQVRSRPRGFPPGRFPAARPLKAPAPR